MHCGKAFIPPLHLKHFVFDDTTGPAKVSRVHCVPVLALPSSYLKVPINHVTGYS